jgi:hypothetical protein
MKKFIRFLIDSKKDVPSAIGTKQDLSNLFTAIYRITGKLVPDELKKDLRAVRNSLCN